LPTLSNKREIQKTNRFGRDVKKLSEDIQKQAFDIARLLSENIFDKTLNVRQMTGFRDVFRVVVFKEYRMIFSFDAENLYLLRTGHRREIYRGLEL
jgi:mRNA-degrading endonuclease RelE of RelBE toxin-antitoxin system